MTTFLRIPRRLSSTAPRRFWSMGLLLLTLGGCDLPEFEGPQIQYPPHGFLRLQDSWPPDHMFPERDVVHHDAWVKDDFGELSTIHINGHAGTLMRADVQTALDAAKERVQDPVTFGEVQEITIDGRRSWGWAERLETQTRGLVWVAYRVAIPYDTITYAIDLYSGDPAFKPHADTLVAIASTFAIGKKEWNFPLIVGIGIAAFVLISFVRKRSHQKAVRLQGINLVTIKKEEEEEEGEGEGEEGDEEGTESESAGSARGP